MIRVAHVALLLVTVCAGCATSYYYRVQLNNPVDPVSFQASLEDFLRAQGLRPFREVYAGDPRFVADVTHGLPRWDKLFGYTLPKGAGFVAVELDPPYNPITIQVGGTDNRVEEQDHLARELENWLHVAYPNIEVHETKVHFARFPW
jgi:hypothetical protein